MLTVRDLRKAYPPTKRHQSGTVALDGVDLDVTSGAFASVLGPSGSGKTTLLRCIAGFERPATGTISLNGRQLTSAERFVRAFERGVGIVPQEGALFPHLSVTQNIGFGLTGRRRATRRARVTELLELVGLSGLGDRHPDQLSGGQQQRVALARALAPEPELILLDEPFSALDAKLRAEVREEVRTLLRRLGSTVLLVTHDQSEAMSLSDHLIVMRAGRVVAAGAPRDVYGRPGDTELAQFLGAALVLDGRIADDPDYVICALGRLPVEHLGKDDPVTGACRVLVRPEQITVGDADDGGAAGGNAVPGTVRAQSYFGHDALLRVEVPGLEEPVAVRVPGWRSFELNEPAFLSVAQPVQIYAPAEAPAKAPVEAPAEARVTGDTQSIN